METPQIVMIGVGAVLLSSMIVAIAAGSARKRKLSTQFRLAAKERGWNDLTGGEFPEAWRVLPYFAAKGTAKVERALVGAFGPIKIVLADCLFQGGPQGANAMSGLGAAGGLASSNLEYKRRFVVLEGIARSNQVCTARPRYSDIAIIKSALGLGHRTKYKVLVDGKATTPPADQELCGMIAALETCKGAWLLQASSGTLLLAPVLESVLAPPERLLGVVEKLLSQRRS